MPQKTIGDFLDAITADPTGLGKEFIDDDVGTMTRFGLDPNQQQTVKSGGLRALADAVWQETPQKAVHIRLRPVRA